MHNITITIDGYLTEGKLREALLSIVGSENWIGNEIKVLDSLKRWDMGFKYNGSTYIIEFDGDRHYADALVISSDNYKNKAAESLGYKIIRIPYFVQLTNQTLKYYFSFFDTSSINIVQSYKHGFIDKKAKCPASYCKLGTDLYKSIVKSLPDNIREDIQNSLIEKSKIYGKEYIMPY